MRPVRELFSVKIYIGTPGNQLQASLVTDEMPVLVSFAAFSPFLERYMRAFGNDLLLDSGAYSVYASGVKVDLAEYSAWTEQWPWAVCAGLDDVGGDWRQSLRNYENGIGFPTLHDTDKNPEAFLDELIPIARERGNWIGIGLEPFKRQRAGREPWLRRIVERIPDSLHVHLWAGGRYLHVPGIHSSDSIHPFLEYGKYMKLLPFLTSSECLELAVKKVRRESKRKTKDNSAQTMELF